MRFVSVHRLWRSTSEPLSFAWGAFCEEEPKDQVRTFFIRHHVFFTPARSSVLLLKCTSSMVPVLVNPPGLSHTHLRLLVKTCSLPDKCYIWQCEPKQPTPQFGLEPRKYWKLHHTTYTPIWIKLSSQTNFCRSHKARIPFGPVLLQI